MFLVKHAVRQCLGILEEVSNVDSKQQPMTAIIELHEIVFSTSHIHCTTKTVPQSISVKSVSIYTVCHSRLSP